MIPFLQPSDSWALARMPSVFQVDLAGVHTVVSMRDPAALEQHFHCTLEPAPVVRDLEDSFQLIMLFSSPLPPSLAFAIL